jgi:hypothetical protein
MKRTLIFIGLFHYTMFIVDSFFGKATKYSLLYRISVHPRFCDKAQIADQ